MKNWITVNRCRTLDQLIFLADVVETAVETERDTLVVNVLCAVAVAVTVAHRTLM